MIYSVNPVVIDPSLGIRRLPTRAFSERQDDFNEKFDFYTLFYDVFSDAASNVIYMLGPALNNLSELFNDIRILAYPGHRKCNFRLIQRDRHTRMEVDAPSGTTELTLQAGPLEVVAPVTARHPESFRARRVITTVSKDNDISWICDWARYHRDVHGADAVLLYDNGSTQYGVGELVAKLSTLSGLASVGVVPFPYPYGPQGFGLRGSWDCDYLQIGSLEHARFRFLKRARSILNCDIDELVVSSRGESVFNAAERRGIVRFYGKWVPNVRSSACCNARPRHADFVFEERGGAAVVKNGGRCQPKWAVVPGDIPEVGHLTAHRIKHWWRSRLITPTFAFRHFRALSTNWKYKRDDGEVLDPSQHRRDKALTSSFAQVRWNI